MYRYNFITAPFAHISTKALTASGFSTTIRVFYSIFIVTGVSVFIPDNTIIAP